MRSSLAVFGLVFSVFLSFPAWCKSKEYPRYEPPAFEELPGTGLPNAPSGAPQRQAPSEAKGGDTSAVIPIEPAAGDNAASPKPPPLEEPPAPTASAPEPAASSADAGTAEPASPAPEAASAPPPELATVPVAEKPAPAPAGRASKPYRVRIWQDNGDCLWRIAEKVYGDRHKWKLIYLANKDVIKDPNKLYPKQRLKIPPADWQPE